jgi:hypothetical protein
VKEIFTTYGNILQLPLILAFLAWWLIGSAWLLQRAIRRQTQQKRQPLGPCALAMFLACGCALIVVGLTYRFVWRIVENPDAALMQQSLAAVPGLFLAPPMALLMLYAVFQFPLGILLRVAWLPLTSIVLAAVVFVGPAFWLGWSDKSASGKANQSVERLRRIDAAIRAYESRNNRQPPANLTLLTEEIADRKANTPYLTKQTLQSPSLPREAVGYFYYPCPSLNVARDPNLRFAQNLRACEWTHSHSDKYRTILQANGEVTSTRDSIFRAMLDANGNEAFRAQFLAAEANRGPAR